MIPIILTGFISYIISAIFNRSAYFLISFFAVVILNIQLLSLFKSINGFNILILTAFEALIAFIIWNKKKYPLLKISFPHQEIKQALKEDKTLSILLIFCLFSILISFILAGLSPVNEPDAQGYHALRALFWLKDGFISHFETADIRCHCMPINSELFYTWLLCITKTDTSFGLLQFFSYFQLIFCSYKIMEKFDTKNRIWSILIFSSLPGVISQISSTQTDLCVGALLVSSIYFILEYKKTKTFNLLFFSSLAMGISFGVKTTSFMAGVPILIWFIFILRKDFIKFFGLLFFNSFIFSAYNYILNFINYGHFLGAKTALLGHGFWGGYKGVIANLIRYVFQFFDFSGFTIGYYLNEHLIAAQNGIIKALSIPSNLGANINLDFTNIALTEQTVGFGILGFLVFLPCTIFAFFKKEFKIYSVIFWAQIILLSASIAYMVYSVRFLTTFICIAIPVFALSYYKKANLCKLLMSLFMIFYFAYASLFLSQRPFYYLFKEFKKTPDIKLIQQNMRNLSYKFYSSFMEALTIKNATEPICINDNKIGIIISNGYMLYSGKFLETKNNCTIKTPSLLHFPQLNEFDYIITQGDLIQNLQTINKNDILNPKLFNEMSICYFEGFDKSRQKRILSPNEGKNALGAVCKLNIDYLKNNGFIEYKNIHAEIPEYLKKRENETIKKLIIFSKK